MGRPMTIEEFDKLDLPEDREWELRNGEVVDRNAELVQGIPPDFIHRELQCRIFELFQRAFPNAHVLVEYPFRMPGINDERAADIGMSTRERADKARKKRVLVGAPEVVVKVLSPYDGAMQLGRDRRVFFEHGTLLFLVVDPDDSEVEVYVKGEKSNPILALDDSLEIAVFGERKTIPVRAIFAGITVQETS